MLGDSDLINGESNGERTWKMKSNLGFYRSPKRLQVVLPTIHQLGNTMNTAFATQYFYMLYGTGTSQMVIKSLWTCAKTRLREIA